MHLEHARNVAQEKRQDPKERADVAAVLSNMGVELSLADVLDQTGFQRPEPGEDVIEKQEPASPFGDAAGVPFSKG